MPGLVAAALPLYALNATLTATPSSSAIVRQEHPAARRVLSRFRSTALRGLPRRRPLPWPGQFLSVPGRESAPAQIRRCWRRCRTPVARSGCWYPPPRAARRLDPQRIKLAQSVHQLPKTSGEAVIAVHNHGIDQSLATINPQSVQVGTLFPCPTKHRDPGIRGRSASRAAVRIRAAHAFAYQRPGREWRPAHRLLPEWFGDFLEWVRLKKYAYV